MEKSEKIEEFDNQFTDFIERVINSKTWKWAYIGKNKQIFLSDKKPIFDINGLHYTTPGKKICIGTWKGSDIPSQQCLVKLFYVEPPEEGDE